jgi:hypothetical protein
MAIQDLDTPRSRSITEMTHSARVISLMDARFDRFLPRDLRVLSSRYWIPLDVAAQAARWLDSLQISTVVDIGSGVGSSALPERWQAAARLLVSSTGQGSSGSPETSRRGSISTGA